MYKTKKQLIAAGAISVAVLSGYMTIREAQEKKEFTIPNVTVTSRSEQSYTLEQQLDIQTYGRSYSWPVNDRKLIRTCYDSELSARADLYGIRDTTQDIYGYPWSAINFFPRKYGGDPYLRYTLGEAESDYSAENHNLRIEIGEANRNCNAMGLRFKLRQ